MGRPQTDEAQEAKSKGKGLKLWHGTETASEHHGATRLTEGFHRSRKRRRRTGLKAPWANTSARVRAQHTNYVSEVLDLAGIVLS